MHKAKRIFAGIEIVFSIVLAIFAVLSFLRWQNASASLNSGKLIQAIHSYREVVVCGKAIYLEVQEKLPALQESLKPAPEPAPADGSANPPQGKFGKWKEWGKKLLKTAADSLDSSLKKNHDRIVGAMDNTVRSLDQSAEALESFSSDMSDTAVFLLIASLCMSVCFFSGGMIALLEERNS